MIDTLRGRGRPGGREGSRRRPDDAARLPEVGDLRRLKAVWWDRRLKAAVWQRRLASPASTEKQGRVSGPIIIPVVIRHLLAPHVPRAADALGIRRTVYGGVALTFDDGPHPEGTPAILEILDEAGIKATFFLVGEQVQRRPALAAQIGHAGHAVALHGYRHRPQPLLGPGAVEDDLARGADAIVRATGIEPKWHRPPYGLYSQAGLDAARERGLTPILWSRWGKDWRRFTTPERIAARATRDLRPGDVILLHDADFYSSTGSHRRTAEALKLIVRELKRQKVGTVLPV